MPDIETISWRLKTGNKFSKSPDAAMDSDAGCINSESFRRIGDVVKSYYKVQYDHDYLVEWIARKICNNLMPLGNQRIHELIDEAWDSYYGNQSSKVTNLPTAK